MQNFSWTRRALFWAPSLLAFSVFTSSMVSSCSEDPKAKSIGAGCLLASDCPSPLTCSFEKCHAQCAADRDCQSGATCVVSDVAKVSVCLSKEEATCSRNSDCPNPLVCGRRNLCESQCKTDRDCLASQTCSQGTCTDKLTPIVDAGSSDIAGEKCSYNSECAKPLVCKSGECQLECKADRDCRVLFGERCVENSCFPSDAGPPEVSIPISDSTPDSTPVFDAIVVDGPLQTGMHVVSEQVSESISSIAGTGMSLNCPLQHAISGIQGKTINVKPASAGADVKDALTQIQITCANVQGLAFQPTQILTSGNKVLTTEVAGQQTTDVSQTGFANCEGNRFLVGLSGVVTGSGFVSMLRTQCAELKADFTPPVTLKITPGAPSNQALIGKLGGSETNVMCPSGQVASGLIVNILDNGVQSVRLQCASIHFPSMN